MHKTTLRGARGITAALLLGMALSTSGCMLLIGGAAAGGAAGGVASVQESEHKDHEPMTYVGTVLANVVYFPAKVIFAVGGAATSGVAYLVTLGDGETAASIWNASVGGDYVVTPSMIAGDEPVEFVG